MHSSYTMRGQWTLQVCACLELVPRPWRSSSLQTALRHVAPPPIFCCCWRSGHEGKREATVSDSGNASKHVQSLCSALWVQLLPGGIEHSPVLWQQCLALRVEAARRARTATRHQSRPTHSAAGGRSGRTCHQGGRVRPPLTSATLLTSREEKP
jgi:hypothetical protein